jgi:hypothetical protein
MLTIALVGMAWAGEPELMTPNGGTFTKQVPIINGEPATEDDYPMAGAMLVDGMLTSDWGDYPMSSFACSSTLIAPDVVLLAAHCIDGKAFTYGYGDFGEVDFYWSRQADQSAWDGSTENPDLPEDAVHAWDRVYHDDWDFASLQVGLAENRDIALLFLDEAVTDVPFAYLPTAEEAAQLAVDNEVVVVGWGQQVASDNPWEAPPAGTYAEKIMGTSFIAELADAEFKVGEEEGDVRKCHGDSGGPSFMDVQTESTVSMRIVGVTSHAYDETDCKETGGVDTRVDHYLDWIDQQMRERCESGERVWCDEPGIPSLPMPVEDTGGDDTDDDANLEGDAKVACGCASPGGATAGLLPVLFGLLALRRRR